jgi:hypothetical protein
MMKKENKKRELWFYLWIGLLSYCACEIPAGLIEDIFRPSTEINQGGPTLL